MCDASNFSIGAALLQSHSGTNKINLISAISRLFTQAELRLSTLMRECTAIIYILTEYLHIVWTAGKNFALRDTLSKNTPPELLTRNTTVEIAKNIKFYLAKDEKSPRL